MSRDRVQSQLQKIKDRAETGFWKQNGTFFQTAQKINVIK